MHWVPSTICPVVAPPPTHHPTLTPLSCRFCILSSCRQRGAYAIRSELYKNWRTCDPHQLVEFVFIHRSCPSLLCSLFFNSFSPDWQWQRTCEIYANKQARQMRARRQMHRGRTMNSYCAANGDNKLLAVRERERERGEAAEARTRQSAHTHTHTLQLLIRRIYVCGTTSNSGTCTKSLCLWLCLILKYWQRFISSAHTQGEGIGGVNILLLSYSIYGLTTSLFKLQLSLWLQLAAAISLCGNYEAASVNLP